MSQAVMPVQIRERWLALDAALVQEVLGARSWVRIPGATAALPGVLAWRGRAIAVLDLGSAVGIAEPLAASETRSRAVVVQVQGSTLAVLVDAAREVYEVPADAVRSPHVTLARFSAGEIDVAGSPMPIVDLAQVLDAASPAPEAA